MDRSVVNVVFLRLCVSIDYVDGPNRLIWELAKSINGTLFNAIPVFLINASKEEEKKCENFSKYGISAYYLKGRNVFDFKQFFELKNIIKKNNVKIVHSNDYKSHCFAVLLKCFFPHLILISTNHGYIRTSWKKEIHYHVDKTMLNFFNANIVVSAAMLKQMPKRILKRTTVVHNSLDLSFWKSSRMSGKKDNSHNIKIGFAARISCEKGWKEFVEIAKIIHEKFSGTKFIIAGDGPDSEKMKMLVNEYDIGDAFTFKGPVNEMKKFYEQIDILLAPSWTEGLPMVQLEANAMEVPVVATDVGGVSELIIDGFNGFLAPVFNNDKIIEQLVKLLENPDLIKEMGKNGRILVEKNFSIQNTQKSLLDIYTDSLDTKCKRKLSS